MARVPKGIRITGAALVAVVGAILLTPPVHSLLCDWGLVEGEDFAKVLRRLLLLPLAAILLISLRPWRDGNLRTYGLRGPSARYRPGLAAYAITLLLLLGLLLWQFLAGWLRWEDPLRWGEFARRVVEYALVGVFIGILEEWFFRGWLDRRLRGIGWGPVAVALVVAIVYALLHAFRPGHPKVTHDVSGAIEVLTSWFGRFTDLARFGPTVIGLFLLSLVLTALWRRTKTLWTGVGVHAAGILVLRSYGALTHRRPQRTWAGTKELLDGPPAWGLLLLALLALWLWPRSPSADVDSNGTEPFAPPDALK